MSGARTQILGSIRQSLGRGPLDGPRQAALEDRLRTPPEGLIPARSKGDAAAQVALFCEMAEKAQTSIAEIDSLDDIPDAVAGYLAGENLPAEVRHADHPDLDAVPWSARPTLTVDRGASDGSQAVGLSVAFGAVAETGTLCLTSGPTGPTTLNFLPATHIVLLRESAIAGTYEAVWDRLRATVSRGENGQPVLPRTVNQITGPSRTGDIEQTIELGAHGPLRLHILLLRDAQSGRNEA